MVRLRRNRNKTTVEQEDDFFETDNYAHRKVIEFHPHCYNQQVELAESKQFDEMYALAHAPVLGENEDEA